MSDCERESCNKRGVRDVCLSSTIINNEKTLLLKVKQTSNFVLPNSDYEYQIYIKNISPLKIKNIKLFILNQRAVVLNEYESSDEHYIDKKYEIKQLKPNESAYITIKAIVTESGEFNVNFVVYGENTSLEIVNKKITCGYQKNIPEIYHQISFFNFDPYEDSYQLSSRNYSEIATQLQKTQHKPYMMGLQPFPMKKVDITDVHSFNVYNQQIDLINKDDPPITYLGREEYESYIDEGFKGNSFKDLINKINLESDLVNIHFLRTGNNEMDLDFKSIYPKGFLDRFGLLKTEVYHRLGVIPTISYMNDYLFRWAKEDDKLANSIYPPLQDYHWCEKVWCGYGFYVWQYYVNADDGIIESKEIEFFEKRSDAELYIERLEEWNNYNQQTRYDSLGNFIEGYFYNIKECLFSEGVFFVNIPMNDIPSNFFYCDIEDLKPIIEKTKPYGMKPIIRYIFDSKFNHEIEINPILKYIRKYNFDCGNYNKINYEIFTKKYKIEDEDIVLKNSGLSAISEDGFDSTNTFDLKNIKSQIKNIVIKNNDGEIIKDNSFNMNETFSTSGLSSSILLNLNDKTTLLSLLNQDSLKEICFNQILSNDANTFNNNKILKLIPTNIKKSYEECKKDLNNLLSFNLNINYNGRFTCGENNNRFDIISLKTLDLKSKDFSELSFCFSESKQDHIISVEYISEYQKFLISYKINKNQTIKVINQFLIENITELSCEFAKTSNKNSKNYMVILYTKNENKLSYLTHFDLVEIIDSKILFRNTGRLKSNVLYSLQYNLLYYFNSKNDTIIYTTPDYDICKTNDNYIVTESLSNNPSWKTLYRINKDEESYALFKSNEELQQPNDFQIYLDNINIPEESIVKDISVKCLSETNKQQKIKISTKTNISYIQDDSNNKLILNPNNINAHMNREDSKYILENLLVINQNQKYNDLLEQNKILNKNINLNYMNIDDYLKIDGDFWIDLDFSNDIKSSLNDVESINFIIEGYNDGSNTNISTELCTKSESLGLTLNPINCGYFYKKIPLKLNSNIMVSDLFTRFKFSNKFDSIKLFDTKLEIIFKEKQNYNSIKNNENTFILENGITQRFVLNKDYEKGIFYNNGILINFSFDSLNKSDLIRLYSIEIEIVYQNQTSRILIPQIDVDDIVIGGNQSDICYFKGEIFSEMELNLQDKYDDFINNKYYHGCELSDSVYQSFIALDDNLTSISIKPNGYYGSPDDNLKISILSNNNKTPGDVLATSYINGWKKDFSNEDILTYPIYVENLIPGETYWFKIEVVNKKENSYYWLKSYPQSILNHKLLYNENGNLYNLDGCLWFSIQSKQDSVYFGNLPKVISGIQKPYIILTIDKNISQISDLTIKKKLSEIDFSEIELLNDREL